MSVNPKIVQKEGEKWVASREVRESVLPILIEESKIVEAQLDTIQAKLGSITTSDPQWDAATSAQQAEWLRKSVVALSAIAEKQLKLNIFLIGKLLD